MTTLSFETRILSIVDKGFDAKLFQQSLHLRYNYFIKDQEWDLPNLNEFESDQYDTIFAKHIVALDEGTVVGTLRILPTTHEIFGNTYMILDAHRGKLPGLPAGLMQHEIVSAQTWEASRFAIAGSVPLAERESLTQELVFAARDYILTRGGNQMLGLMNPVFRRFFRRLEIGCVQFGPTFALQSGPVCVLKYDF